MLEFTLERELQHRRPTELPLCGRWDGGMGVAFDRPAGTPMPCLARLWVALAGVVLLALSSPADPPDPLLGGAAATRSADPLLDPPPLPACPTPVRDDWRLSADFGLPIGLRLQRRLFDTNLWGEIGAGAYVIVPYVSTCLRYDCTLLKRERNLSAVRPGVSATCVIWDPNFATGVDSEFVWQHTFNGKVTTELGVRLGVTVVFPNGGRNWFDVKSVAPVPVVCMMWTWQF
ncbi:MAG: hypothetical protein ABGY75_22500 [Gemmataceae bacterium]